MPKTARYTLVWSPYHQLYQLHESQSSEVQDIVSENPAWLAWMEQATSFAFHGKNGSYTMYKEHKQRGEGYWYAYVRVKGQLSKRYMGRGSNLTLPRLEQTAHELWHVLSEIPWQKDNTPVDQIDGRTLPDLPIEPLLATKLYIPKPRLHLVQRTRLLQRLQQGMDRALTLISAPIGFGKSTVLADWLTSYTIPTAWLSLEAQDNELSRFLSYLLATLQTHDPHLHMSMQNLHRLLHSSSIEVILTRLINDLMQREASLQDHLVLVLDNYHVITNASIHQALSFLLEHLPSWMHLVLATREDPPLPLARLRGRDDLLELRAADLRFTPEEASLFFIDVMHLPLSREESTLLQARTEGWITGLQLAAFSLLDRDDSGLFITAFSGSHHYVVDYLLEEVLKRQSPVVQDFLLQTCTLDQLCAPLCDAVREQTGSQMLLDTLERTNLFLVALDDKGQWYRYHRLFAEALRQQLQVTTPELIPHLYLRANQWYEQHELKIDGGFHVQTPPVLQSNLLTAREQEVLQFLLKGASNREIAHHLVLSMNTVKKHVLNICRKFDVRSRSQVVAKMRAPHFL